MALINWNDKYAVQVKKFDDAHKQIIYYINELFELLKGKADNNKIQLILDNLEDYTKSHFSEEEAEMDKLGYPEIVEHKEKHKKLIEDLTHLRSKKDVDTNLLNIQVLYFLRDWLYSHISKVDKKYSTHFHEKGLN